MAFRSGRCRAGLGEHLVALAHPSALGSTMRSVSYVQRVALEFSGSLFPHAICLGDVDNDMVSACALRKTQSGSAQGRGGAAEGQEAYGAQHEWRMCDRPGVADLGNELTHSLSARASFWS